ncbi:MAG TPA: hypothetical protein VH327_09305 [Gammaproteobacteria bacterium]|jgi:hypothetical protein|nr:hypothetical protein [Gammaproteobacteria bacterium]
MIRSLRLRVVELHHQRERLVERAAMQRGELATVCSEFDGFVHWINRVVSIAGWVRARPGAAGMSVLTTGLVALTGARRWVGRALMLYQVVKFLRARLFTPKASTLAVRSDMEAT